MIDMGSSVVLHFTQRFLTSKFPPKSVFDVILDLFSPTGYWIPKVVLCTLKRQQTPNLALIVSFTRPNSDYKADFFPADFQ